MIVIVGPGSAGFTVTGLSAHGLRRFTVADIGGCRGLPDESRIGAGDVIVTFTAIDAQTLGSRHVEPYVATILDTGATLIPLPCIPTEGSVEQVMARAAVMRAWNWRGKLRPRDLPLGDFVGKLIRAPEDEPSFTSSRSALHWLTAIHGRIPTRMQQVAAVAWWEVDRLQMIVERTTGERARSVNPLRYGQSRQWSFSSPSAARLAATNLGHSLPGIAKQTARSPWQATTADRLSDLIITGGTK